MEKTIWDNTESTVIILVLFDHDSVSLHTFCIFRDSLLHMPQETQPSLTNGQRICANQWRG